MNIKFDEFNKINIHVGTIISIKKNKKARNPALILEIDFGDEIGIKLSSAQITHNYNYKSNCKSHSKYKYKSNSKSISRSISKSNSNSNFKSNYISRSNYTTNSK